VTQSRLTQKQRILKTLKSRKLTQEQAKQRFGIMSLSSRVRELRDDGFPIISHPYQRKLPDGRKVTAVRYSLAV
jgi:Helix-turn-helix domain